MSHSSAAHNIMHIISRRSVHRSNVNKYYNCNSRDLKFYFCWYFSILTKPMLMVKNCRDLETVRLAFYIIYGQQYVFIIFYLVYRRADWTWCINGTRFTAPKCISIVYFFCTGAADLLNKLWMHYYICRWGIGYRKSKIAW